MNSFQESKRHHFLGLSCLAVLALVAPNEGHCGAREDLKGVKQAIRTQSLLLSKTKRVEQRVTGELAAIQRSVAEKTAALKAMQHELDLVEKNIATTTAAVLRQQADCQVKRSQIDKRLAALYKTSEAGNLRIFFSQESFPQMAEQGRYLSSVLQQDRELFALYNQQLQQIKALKGSLEKDAARKAQLVQSQLLKKREIQAEEARKANYLAKVRQQKTNYQASLKELQANAGRLQSIIARLEAKGRHSGRSGTRVDPGAQTTRPSVAVPSTGLGAFRGRLSLPTRGNITVRYGRYKHPEFDSYTMSNGITIAAAAGSPIKAIYDGEILYSDYLKGYGKLMVIDHGEGFYSLYAHAAAFSRPVGAKVRRGEAIGTVGDDGAASQLYFEIRYQGRPVDPSPWFAR